MTVRSDNHAIQKSPRSGYPLGSDSQYQAFLEAAPGAVVIVGSTGEIVLVNARAERLFGYSGAELLGQEFKMLMPERFRAENSRHLIRYARAPRVCVVGSDRELCGRRRDGSEFPVEISLGPLPTKWGMLLYGSIRDVTDQKRTEAASRMLSAMVESSSDAIFGCAVDGTITTWNAAAGSMFGYAAQEAVGRPASLILGEVDHTVGARMDAGIASRLETVGYRKDGSTVDILLSVSFVPNADGTVVGTSCSARDISELRGRRVQEEVDRARLAAAQRAGGVGSFEIDMATGHRWWSGEYRRILGVAATQTASRELMLTRVHSGDRSRVEGVLHDLDFGGLALDVGYRILSPSGRVRWVRSRTSFEFAEDGSPNRILGTTMDVTALHLADAQRRAAETNFHHGFDLSPIGVGMADLDGRFQRVNPAVCSMLGRTKEEILGKRLHDFLHKEDTEGRSSVPVRPRIGESGSVDIERRYLRPDGGVVWVQETMSAVPGVDGEPGYSFVQLQDITSRKRAEQELEHQALHDPLTGLANRQLLTETLEHSLAAARESCGQVSVVFIDIDPFKKLSEGLGHSVGDGLIVQMARRLQSLVRLTDTLARFGGGEFVIVCEDMTRGSTERLAERIVESSKEPFRLGGQELFVTVSVGFVLADGDEDAVTVLRNSDAARYQSKTHGRAHADVFSEEMYRQASNRLDLESQLMRALDKDELRVFYQPIMEASTEEVVGFEALVRWEHSERGLISPLEFIPVAEDIGLIIPIGEWVLREALAQMQRWRTEIPGAEGLSISVNLSALQLQDPNLVGMVADALTQSGADPRSLHLEITESMVMNDIDAAVDTLHALRALGVNLSIDDFGTGHAALSYLIRLPVHTIKIDRSFVEALSGDDPKASSIVQGIVNLAGALDLAVIVEGVESAEQREELLRLGCRLAQGYLWSRPLPPVHIPDWLLARSTAGRARR